jgi:hypothetical protein
LPVRISEFTMGEWPRNFHAKAKEHHGAIESLRLLAAEGMDNRNVLECLYHYSHPVSVKRLRALRKWAGDMAKQMAKSEKAVRQTADELAGELPYFQMSQTAWQTYTEAGTIESLLNAAECLAKLGKHYQKISSQKGKARDEETLVYLSLKIQAITGRPHWGDLAYLLEVAFQTHGQYMEWDKDSVRKAVQRYKKSHPSVYDNMRDFMIELPADKPSIAVTRSTRNRRIAQTKTTAPRSRYIGPKLKGSARSIIW